MIHSTLEETKVKKNERKKRKDKDRNWQPDWLSLELDPLGAKCLWNPKTHSYGEVVFGKLESLIERIQSQSGATHLRSAKSHVVFGGTQSSQSHGQFSRSHFGVRQNKPQRHNYSQIHSANPSAEQIGNSCWIESHHCEWSKNQGQGFYKTILNQSQPRGTH